MRAPTRNRRTRWSREAGFTLAEVLLSGAMAAVLLTALAHSTMEFGYTIHYLEDKAGIADAQDSVLRRVTRDIREAWWAEVVSDTHIKLADEDGQYIQYYLQGDALWLSRPNGDTGIVIDDVAVLEFEATMGDRYREGSVQEVSTSWYVQPEPASSALPLESAEGGHVSLSFDPPVNAAELGGSADEEVTGTHLETVSLAVSWVPDEESDPGELTVSLYETRGPGKPKTFGAPLASIEVPGSSLPQAIDADGNGWFDVPATETALSLSVDGALDPGRGYAIVLSASEDASFVVPAHPVIASPSKNLIATKDSGSGSNWVELAMVVPFSLTGAANLTTTVSQEMVEIISITLQQTNRPEQTRSASVQIGRASCRERV